MKRTDDVVMKIESNGEIQVKDSNGEFQAVHNVEEVNSCISSGVFANGKFASPKGMGSMQNFTTRAANITGGLTTCVVKRCTSTLRSNFVAIIGDQSIECNFPLTEANMYCIVTASIKATEFYKNHTKPCDLLISKYDLLQFSDKTVTKDFLDALGNMHLARRHTDYKCGTNNIGYVGTFNEVYESKLRTQDNLISDGSNLFKDAISSNSPAALPDARLVAGLAVVIPAVAVVVTFAAACGVLYVYQNSDKVMNSLSTTAQSCWNYATGKSQAQTSEPGKGDVVIKIGDIERVTNQPTSHTSLVSGRQSSNRGEAISIM